MASFLATYQNLRLNLLDKIFVERVDDNSNTARLG